VWPSIYKHTHIKIGWLSHYYKNNNFPYHYATTLPYAKL